MLTRRHRCPVCDTNGHRIIRNEGGPSRSWGNRTALNLGRDNIGQHRLTQRSQPKENRCNETDQPPDEFPSPLRIRS